MIKRNLSKLLLIIALGAASNSFAEEANQTQIAPSFLNYLAGLIAENEGDIDMAASCFAKAEISDPNKLHLQEKNFSYQLAKGDMDESYRLAKKLDESGDDVLPLVFVVNAINHVVEGNLNKARKELAKAQKSAPGLLQFKLMEAYLDLSTGKDVDEVVESIRDYKSAAAFIGQSHYHIGRIYEQKGHLSNAELEYRVAMELDPVSIYPIIRLGAIYINSNKVDKAKELYATFIKTNPQSIMLQSSIEDLENNKTPALLPQNLKNNWADVLFGFSTMMAAQEIDLAAKTPIKHGSRSGRKL